MKTVVRDFQIIRMIKLSLLNVTVTYLHVKESGNEIHLQKPAIDIGNFEWLLESTYSPSIDYIQYRRIAMASQILRISSRCSITISVREQQPHTEQKLTISIQNYYKVLQYLLCL
jgi:hypothetical protein